MREITRSCTYSPSDLSTYGSNGRGTGHDLLALFTTARASVATFLDSAGVLQTAAANIARFEYNTSGVLLRVIAEEARTNGIRNNTMVGAVAGTPGTPPTNWAWAPQGATVEIVGTGTSNGIEYIDLKFSGTPTATPSMLLETTTGIDALTTEVWTSSMYLALVGGDATNVNTISLRHRERTEAGAQVKTHTSDDILASLTSSLQRFEQTNTLDGGGTTAHLLPDLLIGWDGAGDIDLTLRVGLPQTEEGATASSVIKTTTAAVTRAADDITLTLGSWFNALEGSLLIEGDLSGSTDGAIAGICSIDDTTANERFQFDRSAANTMQFRVVDGSAEQASLIDTSKTQGATFKMASAWKASDFARSVGGATALTDSGGTLPTVTRIKIGVDSGTNYLNGHIKVLQYYSTRLSNAKLEALSA